MQAQIWILLGVLVIFASVVILVVFYQARAGMVLSPIITHSAFITAAGSAPVRPLALASVADEGLVIAGEAEMAAWAMKVDASGKASWSYSVPPGGAAGFEAEFHGIVSMPDGSTYLCGFVPHPPGGYAPGLLSHLDHQGRRLDERFMIPQNRPVRGIASFDTCARWLDGILLLGHFIDWSGTDDTDNNFYWLIALDAAGKIRWEKQIPMGDQFYADEIGPLVVAGDATVAFSAIGNNTAELLRVSRDGKLMARKRLFGRFRLIQPVRGEGAIQVAGSYSSDNGQNLEEKLTIITLNAALDEVRRYQNNSVGYLARDAYRLDDESIVLFGSAVHPLGGSYTSQVLHVASNLGTIVRVDPPRNGQPFFDSGSIWAAGPTAAGQFVAARGLAINPDSNDKKANDLPPEFQRGLELDYIKMK